MQEASLQCLQFCTVPSCTISDSSQTVLPSMATQFDCCKTGWTFKTASLVFGTQVELDFDGNAVGLLQNRVTFNSARIRRLSCMIL
jgi:hypothetical protein